MPNDTAVYDALAYNPLTVEYNDWVGLGTLEAIRKRGLKANLATLKYCPKEWLIDGFRPKNIRHVVGASPTRSSGFSQMLPMTSSSLKAIQSLSQS